MRSLPSLPPLPSLPLFLLLPLLAACPPTRDPGPGGGDPDPQDAAALYADLEPGQCLAVWDGDPADWMGLGGGYGTTGLWYALDCNDAAGATLTLELDGFEPAPGTVPIREINARSALGDSAGMEAIDNVDLHIESGDWSAFGGWWEGRAELTANDGQALVLRAVVFKDLQIQSVVGR